jgi:hypothetical protein
MAELKNNKKKTLRGAYSRRKGGKYELQLIKELNELYGVNSLVSSRSESKRWDDAGVDIVDRENVLNFYVQAKVTQSCPNPAKLQAACKKKEKPLAIFWKSQVKKEHKCVSMGEYVMIDKQAFYELLKNQKAEE